MTADSTQITGKENILCVEVAFRRRILFRANDCEKTDCLPQTFTLCN